MTEPDPRAPFFDRAWWQNMTSGAVGSAVGTGLVALIAAAVAVAVATGIIKTPGAVQLITNVVIGTLLLGGFVPVVCAAVLIRGARKRNRPQAWLFVAFALSAGWTAWVVVMLVDYQHSRGL